MQTPTDQSVSHRVGAMGEQPLHPSVALNGIDSSLVRHTHQCELRTAARTERGEEGNEADMQEERVP